jgi:hypothetical protein
VYFIANWYSNCHFSILYGNCGIWWLFRYLFPHFGLYVPGVDVMITISAIFDNFRQNICRFSKKNNVMIIILHNFALSWVKSTNFFAKFFGENIFKNHNIGPRKGRRPWLDIGKWRKNVFLWDVGVSAAEYSKLTNGQDGEICWDSLKPKACKKKTRNGMEFAKNFPLMPS